MTIQTVILAAGQGKRMYSHLPKVLHCLAGKPMLEHVLDTVDCLAHEAKPIVIFGHQGDVLQACLAHRDIQWIHQTEQLGTGHALLQALPDINDSEQVLVLYGDVPLISVATLNELIAATTPDGIGMLTANLKQPMGYGRIIRDQFERVLGIVEEKDATPEQRLVTEVNSGIYLLPAKKLKEWLPTLQNNNVQGEYYLTDVISMAVSEGLVVSAVQPAQRQEIAGVNDQVQLAAAERFYQSRQAEKLMRQGVTLLDPARLDVRGHVTIGRDVTIDVGVILEGRVIIGDCCTIGAYTHLKDCELGSGVEVRSHSVLDSAVIGDGCVVGPFSRIRPGTVLEAYAHVGNFVELKNSHVGENSKVNHLSYVGDCDVGAKVNIGAGTITCNYDGVNKHRTVIGDGAFIGSGSELVAPVHIGKGATIGAGSTITENTPDDQLTVARSKQVSIASWKRPVKIKS